MLIVIKDMLVILINHVDRTKKMFWYVVNRVDGNYEYVVYIRWPC